MSKTERAEKVAEAEAFFSEFTTVELQACFPAAARPGLSRMTRHHMVETLARKLVQSPTAQWAL